MTAHDRDKDETGTISVLLERTKRRVPTMLAMKARLLEGDTLADVEIVELTKIFESANDTRGLTDRNPELQQLVTKMISLYEDITELALANERKGGKPPEVDMSD